MKSEHAGLSGLLQQIEEAGRHQVHALPGVCRRPASSAPPDAINKEKGDVVILRLNAPQGHNPAGGRRAIVQVLLALICAAAAGWLSDWQTAVQALVTVLSFFTSINRADTPQQRQCVHCGHHL